jgi:hypothetical protein
MKEVRLRCEFCEDGCDRCENRGYIEKFGTPEEALASFTAVADEIINDEDGEPYMWDFVLRLSLLEVVEI